MDLREKRGILQRFRESILRFRLIFIVLFAVLCGIFFGGYSAVCSFILGASEALGMRLSEGGLGGLWPWLLLLALLLVSRFPLAGKRSGFSLLGTSVAALAFLFLLQGSDPIVLASLILLALVALLLLVLLKHSFGCYAFPAYLLALAFLGCAAPFQPLFSFQEISILLVLLLSDLLAVALIAGKTLAEGLPKASSLLEGLKLQLLPSFLGALVTAAFFAWQAGDNSALAWARHFALSISCFILFLLLGFPLLSFAPFSRLRAETRTLNLKKEA